MVQWDSPTNPEPAIRLENISLTIDGKPILREISFALKPGETLVIMGKNGSGKTMLLKTLVGLFKPEAGRAEIFGNDVHTLDRADLDAAHNFGLGPHTCLGAHLARLEAEVVVPTILRRLPAMQLAGPPEFTPHLFFRVMHRLPVRRGT